MDDGFVFTIDGTSYPFAGDMTMAEASILFDYSGVTLDKLDEVEGFNPQVLLAFMHVAVKRAEPHLTDKQIREKVGKVSASELAEAMAEATSEETDAGPPEAVPVSTDAPDESGPSSGPSSETVLDDPPGNGLSSTGPHRSEITAISPRRASAV